MNMNNSDPGLTGLKQQLDKSLKITFTSPSKKAVESKKENDGNFKACCYTRKHNKTRSRWQLKRLRSELRLGYRENQNKKKELFL